MESKETKPGQTVVLQSDSAEEQIRMHDAAMRIAKVSQYGAFRQTPGKPDSHGDLYSEETFEENIDTIQSIGRTERDDDAEPKVHVIGGGGIHAGRVARALVAVGHRNVGVTCVTSANVEKLIEESKPYVLTNIRYDFEYHAEPLFKSTRYKRKKQLDAEISKRRKRNKVARKQKRKNRKK